LSCGRITGKPEVSISGPIRRQTNWYGPPLLALRGYKK